MPSLWARVSGVLLQKPSLPLVRMHTRVKQSFCMSVGMKIVTLGNLGILVTH